MGGKKRNVKRNKAIKSLVINLVQDCGQTVRSAPIALDAIKTRFLKAAAFQQSNTDTLWPTVVLHSHLCPSHVSTFLINPY